ncbi:DUF7343 domain-containing protein [Halobaculum sp. D14]|uniref:helix-turn-helix transcriptional regulator n=1 Tax=Halobaculum sp. D14 TaxID=3421642 RepID=UPI003EB6CAFA
MIPKQSDSVPAASALLLAVVLLAAPVAAGVATAAVSTGVAATDHQQVRIASSSFGEGDVVFTRGNTSYIWAGDRTTLDVTLETMAGQGEGHYEVCVQSTPADNGSTADLACRSVVLSGNSTDQLTFTFEQWPDGFRGAQSVSVVVTADTLSRDVAARTVHQVAVIEKEADADADGATNAREVTVGTNFSEADTDGDGLLDGLELDTFGSDPLTVDTDGDGLGDGDEVDRHETNPTKADTDGDGLGDGDEVNRFGTSPNRADTDGDGLADALERNTHETDPTAADTDGDGLGDAAEVNDHETNPTAADTDGDGLADALEVYTFGTNPTKADTDDDGLADGAEAYETNTDPTKADTDGDGLGDGDEVNGHGTNPNRVDTDGDGLGDGDEVNRFGTDPTAADTDGDGRGDAATVDTDTGLPTWPLLLPVVGALLGGVAWASRRRWLPYVPERVRSRVCDSPVTARLSAAATRLSDRVHVVSAALTGSTPADATAADAADVDAADAGADGPATPGESGVDNDAFVAGDADGAPGEPGESGGGAAAARQEPTEPPLDTLTNEDAVLAVLRRNGGRIRQSTLVDETGWSKSKVSRVLSRMADDDKVTKINVGRGNVVTLPGDEPDGADSPFDA